MARLSIRTRLLALSLTLLVIPYVGYRYVVEMEGFLRRGLEESLLGGARALAGALHGRSALFPDVDANQPGLYAHALASAPQLDGYAGDWGAVASRYRDLEWDDAGASTTPPRYTLGLHDEHLYLLLEVDDATATAARSADPLSGDHLVLRLLDAERVRHHYLIDTSVSGQLQAFELLRDQLGQPQLRRELRIHGVERRVDTGFALELRLPVALVGPRAALSVTDAGGDAGVPRRAGASRPDSELADLVLPSADIANVVAALGATPGRRVWVVDARSRVLARGGALSSPAPRSPVPAVFGWVLGRPSAAQFADPGPVDELDSNEVATALGGRPATAWRGGAGQDLYVVSAAHPIWSGDAVVGAVLVEETSAPIQTARSQALTDLFISTLVLFAAVTLGLALFASSLSRRLRRLLGEARGAIDPHGRVVGDISERYGGDEIGELAGGMRGLLDRLAQYNRYLERLASRLSHELRTPLAVIRSSLDNIEHLESGSDPQFLERARSGVDRLQSIITRMSEVTRIEEAVRQPDAEAIRLTELVTAAVAGYRGAWPEQRFELTTDGQPAPVAGSPDLLLQMLDKLVANAVDFAAPSTPVEVSVMSHGNEVTLRVINHGSRLPQDMGTRLFESMVSVRAGGNSNSQPHLGLGLYIVRLIVEGHGGEVRARQLEEPERVSLEVVLPREAGA